MTVVRIITYEGSRSDIEEQLARSMKDGVNRPRIGVEITVATVFDSTRVIAAKRAFTGEFELRGVTSNGVLGSVGPVLPENIRPATSAKPKIAKRNRKAGK